MNDRRRDNARELCRWRDMVLSLDGPKDHEGTLVAVGVAKFVNCNTLSTFVGFEKLKGATKLSERTIRRRLKQLIADGYLTGERCGKGRAWASRTFSIRWPAPQAGHDPSRPAPVAGHGASMAGQAVHDGRSPGPPNSSLNSYSPSQPFPLSGKGRSADAGNGTGSKPRAAGTNPRALGTNPRANGKSPRSPQRRSLAAWEEVIKAIDSVKGRSDLTWNDAGKQLDEPSRRAVEQSSGYKLIADRDRYNRKALKKRFRTAYEAQISREAPK